MITDQKSRFPNPYSNIPLKRVEYPYDKIISEKLNLYVENHTDILQHPVRSEQIFNIPQDYGVVKKHVPELEGLFDHLKLEPFRCSFIHVEAGTLGNVHVDPNCTVRILISVRNCEGSITRFYDMPLDYFPKIWSESRQQYIFDKRYIGDYKEFKIIAETELNGIYLFNGGLPHGVWANPNVKEHRLSFSVAFDKDISYLMNE